MEKVETNKAIQNLNARCQALEYVLAALMKSIEFTDPNAIDDLMQNLIDSVGKSDLVPEVKEALEVMRTNIKNVSIES